METEDRFFWTGDNHEEAARFLERTGGFYFLPDGSIDLNWGLDRARPGEWIRFEADGHPDLPEGMFRVERESGE